MNKQQRLRNVAEGLMAGLVVAGFRGPWRWADHQWEGSFYRAWDRWAPHADSDFPRFEIGGSANGRTSQAREILWQLKRTSPFHTYESEPLPTRPRGMTAREYLETCEGATPEEWVGLARDFLGEMDRWGDTN